MSKLLLLVFVYIIVFPSAFAANKIGDYTVFSTRNEAIDWFQNFEINVYAPQAGTVPRKVITATDPRYTQLETYLRKIWAGFKLVYPSNVNDMPVPEIVIIEDSTKGAFALSDNDNQIIPWIFVVHSGFLENTTDVEAMGVIAHELAHIVLQHLIPENKFKMQKYYLANSIEEPLGFLQKNNIELKIRAQRMSDIMKNMIGLFYAAEPAGIPVDIFGDANYTNLLISLLRKHQNDNAFCKKAAAGYLAARNFVFAHFDDLSQQVNLSTEQLNDLNSNFFQINKNLSNCSNERSTLEELLKRTFKISDEVLKNDIKANNYDASDFQLFNQQSNIFVGLLAVIKEKQIELQALDKKVDLKNLRFYSHEEQADEASIMVMRAINEPPSGQFDFLLKSLSKENQHKCIETIKSGKVPYYGSISDTHHSPCYRIYHSKRFIDYLDKR